MNVAVLLSLARVLVSISTLAALLACVWLSIGHAWLPALIAGAAIFGGLGGWTWRRGAQTIILAAGHVWPLLSYLLLGTIEPLATVAWVAAVTTLAVTTAPITRWHLPARWQVPVASWGVLLALGWPIVVARELDFTLISYSENNTLTGVFAGMPRDSAASIVMGTLAPLSAILLVDWLWARYGTRAAAPGRSGSIPGFDVRFTSEVVVPLTIGAVIAVCVGMVQSTIDLTWVSEEAWSRLGRAVGTLFDANAFGGIAALWAAPVAGLAMLSGRRLLRAGGFALLLLTTIAVWGAGSRTALLGLLLSLAGIVAGLIRARRLSLVTAAGAALTLAVLLTAGWFAGGPGSAVRRVWATLPSASAEDISRFADAMWVRDGYGAASMAMLQEHPLTGVGPGAFPIFAPDYWYRLTAGQRVPPDNAQNWWRHQLSELGLVAGLVPIACSLLVFLSIVGALRHGSPGAVIAAGALLGAAAMSILGSPTAHPIVSLTVAVWVFACGAGAAGGAGAATAARSWPAWLAAAVVWLLPIAWAGGTAWNAAASLRPPQRALTIGWPYNYGFSDATTLADGAQQRWVAHRAVAVVETRGSRLVLTFRPGPAGAGSAPTRLRLSTGDGVVLNRELKDGDIATATLPFAPGQKWIMVQVESSRRGPIVGGVERALDLTVRME